MVQNQNMNIIILIYDFKKNISYRNKKRLFKNEL